MDEDDSTLHDSPTEFMSEIAHEEGTGVCAGQTIVPDGDVYRCHCTCGAWDVIAPSQVEGVEMAREHTRRTSTS